MTKGCRNDEVSDGIAPPRHSRAGGNPALRGGGNIQKSSENSEVLDSRFHGNDEGCGNDEKLRE